MRLILLLILIHGWLIAYSQQQPNWVFEPMTGVGVRWFNPTLDPAPGTSIAVLAPALRFTKSVYKGFAGDLEFSHTRAFGDIPEYNSTQLTLGGKYFLKLTKEGKELNKFQASLDKHLSIYPFARYTFKIQESSPADSPFLNSNEGLTAGLGFGIYPFRWLGIHFETFIYQKNPNLSNGGLGLIPLAPSLSITYMDLWPETRNLPSVKASKKGASSKPDYRKPIHKFFAETGLGVHRSVENDEFSGRIIAEETGYFYNLAVGYFFPHNIESGITISLLDMQGSVSERSARRDQYFFAGLFARYHVPINVDRLHILVEGIVNYSDHTYLSEGPGHIKQNRFYVGAAPMLRYALLPRLYISGLLRFNMTLDGDSNTAAQNYPELRLSTFVGKR